MDATLEIETLVPTAKLQIVQSLIVLPGHMKVRGGLIEVFKDVRENQRYPLNITVAQRQAQKINSCDEFHHEIDDVNFEISCCDFHSQLIQSSMKSQQPSGYCIESANRVVRGLDEDTLHMCWMYLGHDECTALAWLNPHVTCHELCMQLEPLQKNVAD